MIGVLDTSVASLLHNNRTEYLPYQHYLGTSTAYISFQTVAEMRAGSLMNNWGIRKRHELEVLLSQFVVVETNDQLASNWAEIISHSKKVGRKLEVGDAWIAATALLLNIPLLTHDKDFDKTACPSINVISFV